MKNGFKQDKTCENCSHMIKSEQSPPCNTCFKPSYNNFERANAKAHYNIRICSNDSGRCRYTGIKHICNKCFRLEYFKNGVYSEDDIPDSLKLSDKV